ncbi:3D-(3,5/4)-trihydroxycyclohexane-1,2-dione acylhydrolase (decyclizing) [Fictibacillus phosphorivorans]|uniref:3D-(3,5/4)-trihydroxycyclohexane-1,2-dione acylhydrolase (decyclizing) n=1 Tax=Fictibacillus phosphorivorans TaxID=1221500 RepID=UPI00203DB0FA|nr:3D-(3,5/4)-trihydroxycyclohexane-1,2-dione acylhydrolase (decyclizing) [Fictibacillus phosphorivorans]MCM3717703.1 3D-(3,5/4)-trihydroxycyclohexane-1,2-dione acylhydrolase (decyclizing) [Fictibacillus phosphorivorans]MCM3775603.1 3D-(3,5/4)-trihydroxycyclohexane-1,2-dione acylhydrolase (decyclizing) [Fictibacillus phosphorivorans]
MANTIKCTTAQALIKFLNNQYIHFDGEEHKFVEGVFNIFGHGNVLGLGQALQEEAEDLKVIQGKNEQGMAHAAVAFAKENFRRKIFAVTTSIGPGSANLVTASAMALANNLPVLFLPGDTFASRQPDPVLQQVEHLHSQKITTNDALQPVSRYWDRIERPEQLMSALLRAFEVLTNPETAGPVTLSIAQDVQGEAFEYDESFFKKRVHYVDRAVPSEASLERAKEAILASKKPLIVVGGGAKYSLAGQAIAEFSTKYKVALAETQAGKSTVSSDHPYNMGGIGVTGTLAANKAAKEADLIIGIGTRYTDFTSASKTAFNFNESTFININVSRMQAYKMDAIQLVGDAKETVERLHSLLDGYESEFGEKLESYKNEWLDERKRLAEIAVDFDNDAYQPEISDAFGREKLKEYAETLETTYPQTNALIKVNDLIDPSSYVITSAGSLPGDMHRLWNPTVENTYHVEYGYSTMGYEVAGALGVKIAHPNKEVYSIVGDGSFLMLHTEMVTALQYGYKINIVLFDNSGFGCINNLQMGHGGDSYCTEFTKADGSILNVDYAKVAEGYGFDTFKVKNDQELEEAIQQAKQSENSTLIEIKVLPKTMTDGYESFWNVGISEHSAKETVLSKAKEVVDMRSKAKQY